MTENLKTAIDAFDQVVNATCELPDRYFNQQDRAHLLGLSKKLYGVYLDNLSA